MVLEIKKIFDTLYSSYTEYHFEAVSKMVDNLEKTASETSKAQIVAELKQLVNEKIKDFKNE